MQELTQAHLSELLDYSIETGTLIWKKRKRDDFKSNRAFNTWNARFSGIEAGYISSIHGIKYRKCTIYGRLYHAHRLIWMLIYREWPDKIDHINGNGLDNRLVNIRSVSYKENSRNQKLRKRNKSGVLGVRWNTQRNAWQAAINDNDGYSHLGLFKYKNDAIIARKMAEYELNYHANHGTERGLR